MEREKWTDGHVHRRAHERLGHAEDQLARDAEVAELDEALLGDEDVARLDVPVDDLVPVQVRQPREHARRHLPEDLFADPAAVRGDTTVDGVERAALRVLHQDRDLGVLLRDGSASVLLTKGRGRPLRERRRST